MARSAAVVERVQAGGDPPGDAEKPVETVGRIRLSDVVTNGDDRVIVGRAKTDAAAGVADPVATVVGQVGGFPFHAAA